MGRVARAANDAELSLVEALVPIVRAEVEGGRLTLGGTDNYLTVSRSLAELLMPELVMLDLRTPHN